MRQIRGARSGPASKTEPSAGGACEPLSAPYRVVVAKAGLDGHDRGAKVIARALRDAGCEVIYMGVRSTVEQIVKTAVQEDADLIGLSFLSGGYATICRKLTELLRGEGVDIPVVVGGVIPKHDVPALEAMGVRAVFGQEHPLDEVVAGVLNIAEQRRRTL